MQSVPNLSKQANLTAAFTTILAVPLGFPTVTVTMVHLVNTSNAAVAVRVCYVPQGGSAVQGNAALWDFSIPANDFLEFGDGQILEPGSSVQALANTPNVVNAFVAGTIV